MGAPRVRRKVQGILGSRHDLRALSRMISNFNASSRSFWRFSGCSNEWVWTFVLEVYLRKGVPHGSNHVAGVLQTMTEPLSNPLCTSHPGSGLLIKDKSKE